MRPYYCRVHRKWYQKRLSVNCPADHFPGDCCHLFEEEVPELEMEKSDETV